MDATHVFLGLRQLSLRLGIDHHEFYAAFVRRVVRLRLLLRLLLLVLLLLLLPLVHEPVLVPPPRAGSVR